MPARKGRAIVRPWISPAEQVIGLYQRRAREWDRDRTRRLVERAWLDRFAALLPRGASILDIGCGFGEPIARHLIENGYAVAGTDSSPALIDLCRARFPDGEWIVADMRRLSLRRRFDGLLAWDSLFHLRPEDQRGMFSVLRAHAAPGAALMFTSGPSHGESVGCALSFTTQSRTICTVTPPIRAASVRVVPS